MGRQMWKPGNMLYPLPAVLVSVADRKGNSNLFTVAWTGTVCSDPPMVSISVRPERYSYLMIEETGEFVVNLTTESLAYATDYCGVRSGRDIDKWREMKLTPVKGEYVQAPMVAESPVNLECRVTQKIELGTHHMFLARVVAVHVDERYLEENGRFCLSDAKPLVYSHGRYFGIGEELGTFGYSVRSKPAVRKVPAMRQKSKHGKAAEEGQKAKRRKPSKRIPDKRQSSKVE
ncbi:MAG: flavin reductase family protein [Lachnospiraceae bacterium]|nr:flavin reductase family protein [Lachnospiraceae bacterium]